MIRTSRVLASALAAVLLAAPPAGASLCVKPKGVVVSRESCRKKEQPLAVEGLVAPGENGAPGAPGQQGVPGGFRVVDSNGALVGYLVYFTGTEILISLALVSTPAGPLAMLASPAGFFPLDEAPTPYYETADCTGTAFMQDNSFVTFLRTGLVWRNDVYYPKEPIADRAIKSYKTKVGDCVLLTTTYSAGELTTFPVSSLGLVPPFSVRLP